MEPELRRYCPIGSGPEYLWRIWDHNGEEVHVNSRIRLDAPTLLIPPSDHTWAKWLHRTETSHVHTPRAVDADAFKALHHDDGKSVFRAQLTIREKDTIVQASPSTTLRVMAMRLRSVIHVLLPVDKVLQE